MLILGIETSGRSGGVALRRDRIPLGERELSHSGRRHAQSLVAELDALLREHHVTARDCQVVAVSVGPGSFTGLRVGVVCAKTFAYATGATLVAVETLACIAENSPPDVNEVQVAADAQRGELFVGRYRRTDDAAFTRVGEILILPAAQWMDSLEQQDVVSGPGIDRQAEELKARCRVLPENCRQPRAETVAWIGERQFARGETANPWTLEPAYFRRSSAEEKWDQRR